LFDVHHPIKVFGKVKKCLEKCNSAPDYEIEKKTSIKNPKTTTTVRIRFLFEKHGATYHLLETGNIIISKQGLTIL